MIQQVKVPVYQHFDGVTSQAVMRGKRDVLNFITRMSRGEFVDRPRIVAADTVQISFHNRKYPNINRKWGL